MKKYSQIALLVVCVLLLTLTACVRPLSTAKPTATTSGEVPFPFATGDIAAFGTQTAIAQTPVVNTPQVIVETEKPAGEGGGQEQPAATQAPAEAQPTTAPAAAVNTPVVTRPTTYVLQKGEWPICIARRYDLDLGTFFSNNGLNMNSMPAVGTNLKIPASGNWSTANYGARSLKQHPADYTVVAGDTVYTIACKYGDVAPESILAVNNLANASDIKAGMKLKIP